MNSSWVEEESDEQEKKELIDACYFKCSVFRVFLFSKRFRDTHDESALHLT
jgi:hypothetical protein